MNTFKRVDESKKEKSGKLDLSISQTPSVGISANASSGQMIKTEFEQTLVKYLDIKIRRLDIKMPPSEKPDNNLLPLFAPENQ